MTPSECHVDHSCSGTEERCTVPVEYEKSGCKVASPATADDICNRDDAGVPSECTVFES